MSLVPEVKDMHNPAINNFVHGRREWISYSDITDIWPTQFDSVYYALYKNEDGDGVEETTIILSLLGSDKICTQPFVRAFARIYALPTHKDNNNDNFRRYSEWLKCRNYHIKGFTEYDGSYYMVADKRFYHCYSQYGFCTACGMLRCSPVWCICGHKELSDGWTSNNKQLDEFITKSYYKQTLQMMPIWNGLY